MGWRARDGPGEWGKTKNLLHPVGCMARQYRQTQVKQVAVQTSGTNTHYIKPLDAEQVPSGYLDKVKVSVVPTDPQGGSPASYLVVASTENNPQLAFSGDVITAQAVPDGGGTVWLSLKRRIASSDEEEDRNDGVVYIHVYTQGTVPSTIVCETWSRFTDLITVP